MKISNTFVSAGIALALAGVVAWLAWGTGTEATSVANASSSRTDPTREDPGAPPAIAARTIDRPQTADNQPPSSVEPVAAPSAGAASELATLRILVLGIDQRPVVDARVVVRAQGSDSAQRLTASDPTLMTNVDGRAELRVLPSDDWIVEASNTAGMAKVLVARATLAAGATRELTLQLEAGAESSFWGRVIEADAATPIPGASVQLLSNVDGGEMTRVIADAEGRFELRFTALQSAHARVEARGRGVALVVPTAGHETSERALVVPLRRGAQLHATITAASGEPGAALEVVVRAAGSDLLLQNESRSISSDGIGAPTWTARTDGQGIASFENLPASVSLGFEVRSGARVVLEGAAPIVLQPGEVREIAWTVGGGCLVEGRALRSRRRARRGVEIVLARASEPRPILFDAANTAAIKTRARCDAAGNFRFENVAAGTWWIGPAPGLPNLDAVASFAELLEIAPGIERISVTLTLTRGRFVRGIVLDGRGQPALGALVSGVADTRGTISGVTGADGRFVLGPLATGTYELRASLPGTDSISPAVVARDGDDAIELRFPTQYTLVGRTVDASNRAISASLVAIQRDMKPERRFATTSTADGAFEIEVGEMGGYSLVAQTSSGLIGVATVALATEVPTEIVVALKRGGTVSVRYDGNATNVTCSILVDGIVIANSPLTRALAWNSLVPEGSAVVQLVESDTGRLETQNVDVEGDAVTLAAFGP